MTILTNRLFNLLWQPTLLAATPFNSPGDPLLYNRTGVKRGVPHWCATPSRGRSGCIRGIHIGVPHLKKSKNNLLRVDIRVLPPVSAVLDTVPEGIG